MAAAKKSSSEFEKSLSELEKIVERMEKGEQTLDQTLKDFERGMTLSRSCQKSLEEAQLKVDKLIKKHGEFGLEPLDSELEDMDDYEDGTDH